MINSSGSAQYFQDKDAFKCCKRSSPRNKGSVVISTSTLRLMKSQMSARACASVKRRLVIIRFICIAHCSMVNFGDVFPESPNTIATVSTGCNNISCRILTDDHIVVSIRDLGDRHINGTGSDREVRRQWMRCGSVRNNVQCTCTGGTHRRQDARPADRPRHIPRG